MNFDDLYEEFSKDIYRFSFWLSGSCDEAKDITSETFIKVWINFRKIRTETMKGLLLTIARNIFIDHQRNAKRFKRLDNLTEKFVNNIEINFEMQEGLKKINIFLMTFPEIDRSAFLLRVEQDLSYEEIARVLEISVSSAKVKVHRVRKKIIEKNFKKEI